MSTVYLNGEYLSENEARVSVNDRGFLFGDGVYEVTPAYRGAFFRLGRHLDRMRRGLDALRIAYGLDDLPELHRRLTDENGLSAAEVSVVYIQVTRGVAPRTHHFPPDPVEPTVYAFADEYHRPSRERWSEGYRAITVPDRRWARVDIKSIALLPNVLSQQAAVDAGVKDTVLVKDGVALEGAHNNLFFVFGDTVVTHPASHEILHGITREFVLELATEEGYGVEERAVQVEEMFEADEVFFTGTTTEVRPCVEVDGRKIGDGSVGPVSRTLFDAFVAGVEEEADAAVEEAGAR